MKHIIKRFYERYKTLLIELKGQYKTLKLHNRLIKILFTGEETTILTFNNFNF